jgi:hypothetical protein
LNSKDTKVAKGRKEDLSRKKAKESRKIETITLKGKIKTTKDTKLHEKSKR